MTRPMLPPYVTPLRPLGACYSESIHCDYRCGWPAGWESPRGRTHRPLRWLCRAGLPQRSLAGTMALRCPLRRKPQKKASKYGALRGVCGFRCGDRSGPKSRGFLGFFWCGLRKGCGALRRDCGNEHFFKEIDKNEALIYH